MSDCVISYTGTVGNDRHTFKICNTCNSVLEEKLFHKVRDGFTEGARKYAAGDEYQAFGYGCGTQHICDTE